MGKSCKIFEQVEHLSGQLIEAKENHIMATIRQYVDVDKDELIRALQYDRNQYEKGFEDGYVKGRADFAEKIQEILNACNEERGRY